MEVLTVIKLKKLFLKDRILKMSSIKNLHPHPIVKDWFFTSCVPVQYMLEIGEYFENKDWCEFALEIDPDLEYLNTPEKRTAENFHTLNRILGTE